MSTITGPLQMFLHPRQYWKRWMRIYKQWEFWALSAVVIGTYVYLDSQGSLPDVLRHNSNTAKALITALIMIPMPYLLHRKEQRLKGRDDAFVQLLKRVQPKGQLIPRVIAFLLLVSTASFLSPIFVADKSTKPLSGLELIFQHPIVIVIPLLYLISLFLLLRDYKEWRWTAFFWILGAYAGMWTAALAYTNVEADVAASFEWVTNLALIVPLIAMGVCLIPPKSKRS